MDNELKRSVGMCVFLGMIVLIVAILYQGLERFAQMQVEDFHNYMANQDD